METACALVFRGRAEARRNCPAGESNVSNQSTGSNFSTQRDELQQSRFCGSAGRKSCLHSGHRPNLFSGSLQIRTNLLFIRDVITDTKTEYLKCRKQE